MSTKRPRPGPPAGYVAVVGINWLDAQTGGPGRERRAEPGEPVPAGIVQRSPWLREQGLVRRPDEREAAEAAEEA